MPGFDGTGPMGKGTMTGGGFGYCRTENSNGQGSLNPRNCRRTFNGNGFRRRNELGAGCGRGFRNRFYSSNINTAYRNSSENENN